MRLTIAHSKIRERSLVGGWKMWWGQKVLKLQKRGGESKKVSNSQKGDGKKVSNSKEEGSKRFEHS